MARKPFKSEKFGWLEDGSVESAYVKGRYRKLAQTMAKERRRVMNKKAVRS